MKIQNYLLGMCAALGLLLSSCEQDNEKAVYGGSTMGVTFGFNSQSVSFPAEGYEGFFHLTAIAGTAERAELRYILRDHDGKKLEMRREMMEHIAKTLNARYGEGTVSVSFREQYRNMAEKIRPDHMHLVENAVKAAEECGVKPLRQPIRGGTDGAQLSWEGLPCPNLGTGGYAFHGPYEHVTVEGMDKCVAIIRRIVEIYAERSK